MYSASSHADLVAESIKGDIDTGFLQVYGPENEIEAQKETAAASSQLQWTPLPADPGQHDLTESFADTYLEYCYPFCPVLDPAHLLDEVARSPLLANALATAGSHVQPPLVPHAGPAEYYARARTLFYNDEEPDPLATLKAIALFYWWAPKTATIVHRHSSWWWTSVLVRHSQQMDLHRELPAKNPQLTEYTLSVRRRIWWTAYVRCVVGMGASFPILWLTSRARQQARERLTALCQSKPAIIDPADCTVREVSLADFPNDPAFQRKGDVFIRWVRLCGIMGRLAKTLYRPDRDGDRLSASTKHLYELSEWINTLPPHLELPIQTARTQRFDRDVHQLHLPYLTTVIILHLKRRTGHGLPHALPPAIMAAYCISRILRDILARGNSRFLMAITCWYTGSAFIPLLQASRIPHLARDANECLDVLERTAEQLQTMWASANLIVGAFRRLRRTTPEATAAAAPRSAAEKEPINPSMISYYNQQQQLAAGGRRSSSTYTYRGQEVEALTSLPTPVMGSFPGSFTEDHRPEATGDGIGGGSGGGGGFDWLTLFPFVTHETSRIVGSLLDDRDHGVEARVFPSPENTMYHEALMSQLDDMFAIDGLDFMTGV